LTLVLFGTEDEVLTGNNSQILLDPGENKAIEIKIQPIHASTHQLEIYLLYEGLTYYTETLKFNVAPQWLSPRFLFPIFLVSIILLLIILVVGTSLLYFQDQLLLQRVFWEQKTQLTKLIDQITIVNLEESISNSMEGHSNRPLGFPEHLQPSHSLNRGELEKEFYILREQIIKGDLNNLYRLSKLLTQVEELLKESQED
jgi:hypothetical protein